MTKLNVETWNNVYSEGRSLLVYPDETVVSILNKHKDELKIGLDIACGAGRHTFLMSDFGIEAYGIDSSESAIKFAKQRAENENNQGVHFSVQTINELKEEGQYDIIIMWGLFHYLSEEEQKMVLSKINKLLKPGGYLVATIRSIEDSRKRKGKKISESEYLVDYFDENSKQPKQTLMKFYDEKHVIAILEKHFKTIEIGHRSIQPIGNNGMQSSHWLIKAKK